MGKFDQTVLEILIFYSIIITNINIFDYELVRIFTFYNLIHILAIFMPLSFYGFITIPKHTRLVQICSPTLESINVEIVTKLSDSERGENGFGSTGTTEIVELSDVDEIDSNDEDNSDEGHIYGNPQIVSSSFVTNETPADLVVARLLLLRELSIWQKSNKSELAFHSTLACSRT